MKPAKADPPVDPLGAVLAPGKQTMDSKAAAGAKALVESFTLSPPVNVPSLALPPIRETRDPWYKRLMRWACCAAGFGPPSVISAARPPTKVDGRHVDDLAFPIARPDSHTFYVEFPRKEQYCVCCPWVDRDRLSLVLPVSATLFHDLSRQSLTTGLQAPDVLLERTRRLGNLDLKDVTTYLATEDEIRSWTRADFLKAPMVDWSRVRHGTAMYLAEWQRVCVNRNFLNVAP